MKLFKRLFCKHEDLKENRIEASPDYPFGGYVFICPKCGSWIGYSKEYSEYFRLSEKSFNEYIELFINKK